MASSDLDDVKNRIVYFGTFEAPKVGWGVEGGKRGVTVHTEQGPRRLEPREVLHISALRVASMAAALSRASESLAIVGALDMRTVWELLVDEGESSYSLRDLAGLGGVGSEETALDGVQLLLESPLSLFKLKAAGWVPLSRKQVEERELQARRTAERNKALGSSTEEIAQALAQGLNYTRLSAAARETLIGIERVALEPDVAQAKALRALQSLFPEDQRPGHVQAFALLVSLGYYSIHEDLNLRRLGATNQWPAEVLSEVGDAKRRAEAAVAQRRRVDLVSIAIDDPETTEVDDALAIEKGDHGWIVHVLIADPAVAVPRGGALDLEAQRRASTIYHPTGRIPMLPESLSGDALSLTPGELRPATDFALRFDANHTLQGFTVEPVALCLTARLSYDEANEMLATGQGTYAQQLKVLHDIASSMLEVRHKAGAFTLHQMEIRARVEGEKVTLVKRHDPSTPSHTLVAEYMVAAGSCAADYMLRNKLPAIFRTQPKPDSDLGFTMEKASDPVYVYATVRKLRRSDASTHAGAHSAMGVQAYCQVTSPLRRYVDLALQRQLTAHALLGRPELSADEMLTILGAVEPTALLVRRAGDEANRYWLTHDLKSRAVGQNVRATVLHVDRSFIMVLLNDWGLQARVNTYVSTAPGQDIELTVVAADPRSETITLRPVSSQS